MSYLLKWKCSMMKRIRLQLEDLGSGSITNFGQITSSLGLSSSVNGGNLVNAMSTVKYASIYKYLVNMCCVLWMRTGRQLHVTYGYNRY